MRHPTSRRSPPAISAIARRSSSPVADRAYRPPVAAAICRSVAFGKLRRHRPSRVVPEERLLPAGASHRDGNGLPRADADAVHLVTLRARRDERHAGARCRSPRRRRRAGRACAWDGRPSAPPPSRSSARRRCSCRRAASDRRLSSRSRTARCRRPRSGRRGRSPTSAKPTSAMRSMPSGFCRTKLRISSVAREKRDGRMSRAFIDAERSSMTMRSWRSYSGKRCVTEACGRTSARARAAAARTRGDRAPPRRVRRVARRESEPKRRAIAEAPAERIAQAAMGHPQGHDQRHEERPRARGPDGETSSMSGGHPTCRPGRAVARGCGRSSCISWFGGILGCLRSAEASRVTSSKSYFVSQSSGAASTARRSSSSARVSQPNCSSGFPSPRLFAKNARPAQKCGAARVGRRAAPSRSPRRSAPGGSRSRAARRRRARSRA